MENDLISRSALVKTLEKIRTALDQRDEGLAAKIMQIHIQFIECIPAVDAVEVVRCKNCEFFEIDEGDFIGLCKCGSIATNYGGEIYPEEDFFCAYGERRDDDV